MSDPEDGIIVTVTSKGQATIPKEVRDKLHIDAPGRIRFVENKKGEIVVRPVKRPSEHRDALASDNTDGKSATKHLREERQRDKKTTDKQHGLSEQSE